MYYYYLLLTELVVTAAAATGSAFSTPQLDGRTVVQMISY